MRQPRPTLHGRDHLVGSPDPILDDRWIPVGTPDVPFENSWTNAAGQPVEFTLGVGGWLRIRGSFTGGADGTTVFTLPDVYRPLWDTPVDIPLTDPDGIGRVVVQADGQVVYLGAVSATGGGTGTDTIWDAKGDLAAGTGPDTAVRVPVGADGQTLVADSTQPAGVRWATFTDTLVAADPICADCTVIGPATPVVHRWHGPGEEARRPGSGAPPRTKMTLERRRSEQSDSPGPRCEGAAISLAREAQLVRCASALRTVPAKLSCPPSR